MRIVIDASSTLVRSAGVKSYTFYWLRHLRDAARKGEEIRAFPFLGDVSELDHERSVVGAVPTLARLAVLFGANAMGSWVLDAAIGEGDVFHAGTLVHRAPSKARLTATVHDLTSWILPEHHTSKIVQGDLLFAERILKKADGLIAVSENTRRDAIRLLGISSEKIRTIYSGVAEEYFDAKPMARGKPYVLCAGTIEPRKNVPTLLDAWRALPASLREEFDLVIAGPEGWQSAETVARIRAEATYLGYVPEADMPGLFAGASVFAYPSLYEGFGFPVVQAMAAGVPVVTSNTSCLPEIVGDAAVLVDPRSSSEIKGALAELLGSTGERERLAKLGRERAERYRWRRCAEESLEFFRKIMAADERR